MDNQKKVQGLNIVMNGITINGPMFDIHDNHNVILMTSPAQGEECSSAKPTAREGASLESVLKAAESCQSYFWAQSSWAVVYCVCRDHLKMNLSMNEFERHVADYPLKPGAYPCPEGTIRKALSNNPDMHSPISRWPEGRTRRLAEALIKELA